MTELKWRFRVAIAWGACCFALFTAGCDVSVNEPSPEPPPGLPENTVWVGGADGGAFVWVAEQAEKSGRVQLNVFFESGDVWFEGVAEPKPNLEALALPLEAEDIQGWDGERLLITKQRALAAIDPPRL